MKSARSHGQLLENRRHHDEPVSEGIGGNDQEAHLPGKRHPDETIEVFRVGDRWREVPPDPALHEILRKEHNETVEPAMRNTRLARIGGRCLMRRTMEQNDVTRKWAPGPARFAISRSARDDSSVKNP
jgi:hypothetical protein